MSPPDPLHLTNRLTELLLVLDAQGQVVQTGATVAERLGRSDDELVGSFLRDLVHGDDRTNWDELVTKSSDEDGEARGELRLLTASGGWRVVEVTLVNQLHDPAIAALVVAAVDRTEERAARDELRHTAHLLDTLARASTDVLFLLDGRARLVWASPTLEHVFGYRPDQLIGLSAMEFVHPDDLAGAGRHLEWLNQHPGQPRTTTWRVRHADGTWRWVESVNVNLLEDPDVAAIVASFRDVTERRQTEMALTESEARFRAVVQNSRDVTTLLDPEWRVVWSSPNAGEMLGFDPDALIGTPALDLVHPEDRDMAGAALAQVVVAPDRVNPVVVRLRHRDDGWIPVEAAGSSLRGPGGDLEGTIVNLREVAWRIEAEQALRKSEERFRALVQNSSDVVVVVGADGIVSYVSPSVRRVFGRSPEDVVGTRGGDLAHPDDFDLVAHQSMSVADRPGATVTVGYRVLDAAGHWRNAEATLTNLLEDPAVQGLVFNIRDVTDRVEAERARAESQAMFRSVAQSSPLGLYTVDRHGNCLWVNDRWQEITGVNAEEAAGQGWMPMVHPDDLEWLLSDMGHEAFTAENDLTYRVVRPDGHIRWVSVHTSPLRSGEDGPKLSVGVMEDITDRIGAERDTQRLIDIFEATQDLIGMADSDARFFYLNRAARRFFGLPAAGPIADFDPSTILAPWSLEVMANEMGIRLRREGIWNGELGLVATDGREVPVSSQVLVHHDAEGNVEFYSMVLRDISERKAFEHQLAHQATHDPLTGLPNRVMLLDQLTGALHRGRRHGRLVAVLFLDLDHFKVVNDSLGHSLGDRLLVATADRLRTALRPGDTIARFGGDEFVLLCEDLTDADDVVAIARRVEAALADPFTVDESEIYVGVSIGIALADYPGAEPETLIRDADAAMYRAKEKGRARYEVFDSAMRDSAVDRLVTENALRRSIDRRELRVHYQPIVDLTTGAVTGVEALLRWEHPERGLLQPGDFITIAEETGLIVPIGGWVLAQACRQIQRWQVETDSTSGLVVTVNLSGRQLSHPRLLSEVEGVLDETGIDPTRVHLEITESVLMDDVDMSAQTLSRLKDLGVRLLVDDFGTGYSSLSYLRQFPVDGMKVDRSFVAGLGVDQGDSAIVAAIVNLAHTLGLSAIGEGVETLEQLTALRTLGCDFAQGFHISRPVPPEALVEFLGSDPRF